MLNLLNSPAGLMSIKGIKLLLGSVLFWIPQPGKSPPNLVLPSQLAPTSFQFVATLRTRHQSLLNSKMPLRLIVSVACSGKYNLKYTNRVVVNAQRRKTVVRWTNSLCTPWRLVTSNWAEVRNWRNLHRNSGGQRRTSCNVFRTLFPLEWILASLRLIQS